VKKCSVWREAGCQCGKNGLCYDLVLNEFMRMKNILTIFCPSIHHHHMLNVTYTDMLALRGCCRTFNILTSSIHCSSQSRVGSPRSFGCSTHCSDGCRRQTYHLDDERDYQNMLTHSFISVVTGCFRLHSNAKVISSQY
jgi:hypothetical protein